jgi:hypothetical protein
VEHRLNADYSCRRAGSVIVPHETIDGSGDFTACELLLLQPNHHPSTSL